MKDVIASHQPKFEGKWFGIWPAAAVPHTLLYRYKTSTALLSLAPYYS